MSIASLAIDSILLTPGNPMLSSSLFLTFLASASARTFTVRPTVQSTERLLTFFRYEMPVLSPYGNLLHIYSSSVLNVISRPAVITS